eukprot:scpid112558/ scgid4553/ 
MWYVTKSLVSPQGGVCLPAAISTNAKRIHLVGEHDMNSAIHTICVSLLYRTLSDLSVRTAWPGSSADLHLAVKHSIVSQNRQNTGKLSEQDTYTYTRIIYWYAYMHTHACT